MSYFDQQCLQALQGIERNLERIANMYEKKELREIWMPRYELSPKKELTYGDIFQRFKDRYPSLANHVTDYRPAEEPNSIIILLDIQNAVTGSRVIIYNYETSEIKEART